jgi:hypothetical protein
MEARKALARKVSEIPDLQVSPYMLSEPTPPAAHVFPTPIEYDETFQRGSDKLMLTLQVIVSTGAGDRAAQAKLDAFLEPFGPKSVKQKIEEPDTDGGEVTLGGIVDDLRVTRCEGYRLYQREGRAPVLGSEWIIEVAAPGYEQED